MVLIIFAIIFSVVSFITLKNLKCIESTAKSTQYVGLVGDRYTPVDIISNSQLEMIREKLKKSKF